MTKANVIGGKIAHEVALRRRACMACENKEGQCGSCQRSVSAFLGTLAVEKVVAYRSFMHLTDLLKASPKVRHAVGVWS